MSQPPAQQPSEYPDPIPFSCAPPLDAHSFDDGPDEEFDDEFETEHDALMSLGFPAPRFRDRLRGMLRDEAGAVTAEYALIIMAGVAFAGVLILIMRSEEVRSMLLNLVQNALSSAG